LDVGEDNGPDKTTCSCDLLLHDQASFSFSHLDVLADLAPGAFVDHRAHASARIFGRANSYAHDGVGESLEEQVIDRFVDNRSRTGGALLSLEACE